MSERRIFTGTSSFPMLRENQTVYVDKTALVYRLVKADTAFFLSRPRRFGKSLLISTLEAYFQGRSHLFQGLAMEALEKDWVQYPVLRFDMSGTRYGKPENLEIRLNVVLSKYEKIYGREDYAVDPASRLHSLIERAKDKDKNNVVVLVDEYDAPLLDAVTDTPLFADMRDLLRSFYSPLKESGESLRFVFLTGITKFSQLSIFSELNNLKVITMDDAYAGICGITEEEIRTQLKPEVNALAEKYGVDFEEAMTLLKKQYDGYHFTENSPDIYNPYSLLNCFQNLKIGSYWYSSGTPTHLTEILHRYTLRPEDMEGFHAANAEIFDAPTERADSPIPVLYQSGYLTIKAYRSPRYLLGFPNEEVRMGFLTELMPFYSKKSRDDNASFLSELMLALEEHDIERAMRLLRSFFSSIPYDAEKQDEDHYKTMFYLIFRLAAAFAVRTEERSAAGRCDALVETQDAVYLFEFKLHGTAQEALAQIDDRGYMIPYEATDKQLYKIGACFDDALKTLKEWLVADSAPTA